MIEHQDDLLHTFSRPPRLSFSDICRLRDLRALEENLTCIKRYSGSNRDDIHREKEVLRAVRREIRRRERINFLLELGSQ